MRNTLLTDGTIGHIIRVSRKPVVPGLGQARRGRAKRGRARQVSARLGPAPLGVARGCIAIERNSYVA
jgi:hypothetical protein